MCTAAAEAIRALGAEAEFRAPTDIVVAGRKISGTGGALDGDALLYQGTLLIDFDYPPWHTAEDTLDKIEKVLMGRMLHEKRDVAELFVKHLLSRNIRYEADLVDQLFNSSEKRLARILLLLAHFGKESKAEPVIPRISQDDLAQMVGTTRSRVSHFMNKFRNLGFIDYSDNDGLTVHSGLLGVVLHD